MEDDENLIPKNNKKKRIINKQNENEETHHHPTTTTTLSSPTKKKKNSLSSELTTTTSTSTIDWNEIDIDNLKNLKMVEINTIAYSIGIQAKLRKNIMIETIKSNIEMRKNIIEKKKSQLSNNPWFNKSKQTLLLITQDISKTELLFWKLFRNKIIFKSIMGWMDTQYSIPYQFITSLSNLINGNHYGIIRDKVNRNQHLIIDHWNCKSLFETIYQETDENITFYRNLFSNYGKYLPIFQTINNSDILNHLISSKCLISIKILISDYSFIPTTENLIDSIKSSKLKFIQLFLSIKSNLLNNNNDKQQQQIQIIDILTSTKENYRIKNRLKVFIYLVEIKFLQPSLTTTISNLFVNKKLEFIQSFLNNQINPIKDFKLGHLVNLIKLIKLFEIDNSIDNVALIGSFSTKQLSSRLNDMDGSITGEIKKLLEIFYKVNNGNNIHIGYEIQFNGNIKKEFGNDKSISYDIENLRIALEYGNHLIFTGIWKDNVKNEDILWIYHIAQERNETIPILFKNQQDKELQIQFLNSVISNNMITPYTLLTILIDFNDLSLIQHSFKSLPIIKIQQIQQIDIPITRYIKSIEILDYLYKNYNHLFQEHQYQVHVWSYFKTESLFKHFINLKLQQEGQITIQNVQSNILPIKIEFLNIIIDNFKYFQIEELVITKFKPINLSSSKQVQEETCKFLKFIIENTNCKFNLFSIIVSNSMVVQPKSTMIKFLNWVYQNYENEFQVNGRFETEHTNLVYYYTGKYNQLLIEFPNSLNYPINQSIVTGNTSFLDTTMKYLIDSNSNLEFDFIKRVVYKILKDTVDNDQIILLEYLFINYNQIFKKKTTTATSTTAQDTNIVSGILSQSDFTHCIHDSLRFDKFKCCEFLLNIFTITKLSFQKRSSFISYNLYKHKFFIK